jgi:hypothetical protein
MIATRHLAAILAPRCGGLFTADGEEEGTHLYLAI